MRVALLKDPEIRARIERPAPLPEAVPEADIEGAAPEDPVEAPPPAPEAPTTPQGGQT